MSEIPVARKRRTSYENFVAECPWCGRENIFNRASDLHSVDPIAGLDVSCLSADCGKPFRLTGDSVNSPHEMLIFDCYELLERKHYMNAVLSLAQAYEVRKPRHWSRPFPTAPVIRRTRPSMALVTRKWCHS